MFVYNADLLENSCHLPGFLDNVSSHQVLEFRFMLIKLNGLSVEFAIESKRAYISSSCRFLDTLSDIFVALWKIHGGSILIIMSEKQPCSYDVQK